MSTNTIIHSDSQESALFGEEEYNEIERAMGGVLPSLTEDIKEEFLEISEEKYDNDETNNNDNIALAVLTQQNIPEEYLILDQAGIMPLDDTFPGYLNFQYTFADGGSGQDWVYSQSLDKLFIKMEKTLALRFTWDPNMEGLYLRTKMVFKLEQYRSDPVKRCHNHMASSDYFSKDPEKIKHVVHCVNHSASMYEEKNGHLSILTPLCTPEPGSQYVPMCYKFLCKNSCQSGMNRRPTELVFTLENIKRVVLGRRKLLVRVCSCPKRDKQKEEAELTPITTIKHMSKKLQSSNDSLHPYKVDLTVLGKENYLAVVKFAYDIMAGQAARTGQYEFFKPYMENIQRKTP